MTRTRWWIAVAALGALLAWPTLAHAVTYRFLKPVARGGSPSNSGADSSNAWPLCKANLSATAGMTFVLMPGDYSADPTSSGLSCGCCLYFDYPQLQNDIAPQSRGTGSSPDSSIRFMSYAYYATGDTAGINNYTVDAIGLGGSDAQINGGARVVIIGIRADGVSISKDKGITDTQRDSLKWCYTRNIGINGVNTVYIYGCTMAGMLGGDSVCPDGLPSSLVEIGGNSSGCFPTCVNQTVDVSIRKCTIRGDSLRSNGKLFKIGGRSSRVVVDSCDISGIASPVCGGTAIFGLWHDGAAQGNTFKDNRWTLDMIRGQGGTSGDLSLDKNKIAFYWLYLRDSTSRLTFLRDTVNCNTRAMSGPGCGILTHWSASGASVGPINNNNFENCVIRGELSPLGWDAQYQFDNNRWYGNSFFVDSGGSPFRIHGQIGEGNIWKRNTIVARGALSFDLESGSVTSANPANKNRVEENIFVRMNTSCAANGSGAIAFMQSPLSFPNAFIINKNLYYSYTGAVSQSVSWGGSRGSCVGQRPGCVDSCQTGGCASTPAACWPVASSNLFDPQSKWGNPLFTDTTAAAFSGNIRCFEIGTGTRSAAYGMLPDSAVGARQPQGADVNPREPYEYVTDSLGYAVVIDTISTSAGTITFKFKAPPDNELTLTGTPSEYQVAVSNFPIDNSNFGTAEWVQAPTAAAPGTTVSFTINVDQSHVYFVAVRTVGSCGRLSSNVSVNGCAVARGSLFLCE